MRFSRDEVQRARKLREIGLLWRPAIGDWFVTDDGFVSIITGNGDGLKAAQEHTWLPQWRQCRNWLRERGYSLPEVLAENGSETRIQLEGPDGKTLHGTGESDRSCLYAIIEIVLSSWF